MRLEEIRRRHHQHAQLAAEGKSAIEVAEAMGSPLRRVESLLADPAFCDLVAHYRSGGTYQPLMGSN